MKLLLILALSILVSCQLIICSEEVTELKIETVHKPSDCAREAKRGDLLSMHYKGTLLDGTVFDSR